MRRDESQVTWHSIFHIQYQSTTVQYSMSAVYVCASPQSVPGPLLSHTVTHDPWAMHPGPCGSLSAFCVLRTQPRTAGTHRSQMHQRCTCATPARIACAGSGHGWGEGGGDLGQNLRIDPGAATVLLVLRGGADWRSAREPAHRGSAGGWVHGAHPSLRPPTT